MSLFPMPTIGRYSISVNNLTSWHAAYTHVWMLKSNFVSVAVTTNSCLSCYSHKLGRARVSGGQEDASMETNRFKKGWCLLFLLPYKRVFRRLAGSYRNPKIHPTKSAQPVEGGTNCPPITSIPFSSCVTFSFAVTRHSLWPETVHTHTLVPDPTTT